MRVKVVNYYNGVIFDKQCSATFLKPLVGEVIQKDGVRYLVDEVLTDLDTEIVCIGVNLIDNEIDCRDFVN